MCERLQLLPGNRWLLQSLYVQFLQRGNHVLRLLYIAAGHDYGELSAGQLVRSSLLPERIGLQRGRQQHLQLYWHIVHQRRQHILQSNGRDLQFLLPQQHNLCIALVAKQQWQRHLRARE